jgi:glycosyltransferase involved in cell wall biosynthesis
MWGFELAGGLARLCDEHGIPWRIVPLDWVSSRMRKLRTLVSFTQALREARPDVLLPYTLVPNIVCGLVWPCSGAQLSIWNQRGVVGEGVPTKVHEWAVARTRCFISNSRHGAEYLMHRFGLKPGSVNVVPNGVELDPPQADEYLWRSRLGIGNDVFIACMVANLSTYKDHATLLRAWSMVVNSLRARGKSAVLLLAGRFAHTQDTLKALAFDLELGKSVRFLGPIDDVSGLLSAVDLGVFSSRSEGSPNGVLECMAAGLPVVGTDEPGIREVLGPDGNALLAPPGDTNELAALILDLVSDPQSRARLGRLNRTRIQEEFSVRAMCEQSSSLIVNALSRRSS